MKNKNRKDSLGDRIKGNYESRCQYFLPRRSYVIIRLDGKSFHTFTKGMKRPFDLEFVEARNQTALYLCNQIQGCKLAYTQSDEITLLITDFDELETQSWFDNNLVKMVSISAAMATASFNFAYGNQSMACFDSRAFTVPHPTEVENVFIWRQKDAIRNSVQMVAQSMFSHKELQGKSSKTLKEMLKDDKQVDWSAYDQGLRQGRVVFKGQTSADISLVRPSWVVEPAPDFVKERSFLGDLIPKLI